MSTIPSSSGSLAATAPSLAQPSPKQFATVATDRTHTAAFPPSLSLFLFFSWFYLSPKLPTSSYASPYLPFSSLPLWGEARNLQLFCIPTVHFTRLPFSRQTATSRLKDTIYTTVCIKAAETEVLQLELQNKGEEETFCCRFLAAQFLVPHEVSAADHILRKNTKKFTNPLALLATSQRLITCCLPKLFLIRWISVLKKMIIFNLLFDRSGHWKYKISSCSAHHLQL